MLFILRSEGQTFAESNLNSQQIFNERKGKYINTFYLEGEIKTMVKTGRYPLLEIKIKLSILQNNRIDPVKSKMI